MSKRTILVVDDEPIARDNLAHIIAKDGHAVRVAADGREAVAILRKEEVDLVLTDLCMQGIDGMAVLEEAKQLWPAVEVVVITGHASVDTAVEAMRKGAYHYVAKPFKINELRAIVDKALEKSLLRREIRSLREQVDAGRGSGRIVGQSPKMQALRETINQVSQLDCNVLVQGETGTGKELVARTIHELSPRARKRFVAFNCGVFTEELITSELFGYERGAFTGAGKAKKGLLEMAEGGTVFFDEVGELPLAMQVKLLRVLQERTLIRVGGTEEIAVDFRVLAATNKDLKREVEAGTFRSDLYYRLDVLTIAVPSLAERKEDIPLLARHFLAKHARPGRPVPLLSPEAERRLLFYDYPGNIRELENIAQRMLITCDGDVIEAQHLAAVFGDSEGVAVRDQREDWHTLEEHEKQYILEVLDEVEGNRSAAVKILGIDRVSLWRKIKRYGLEHPDT
ncbi:sigma-54-dependent transcriptional regulator [Desulfobulbus elongatus]|uniref:sigma-54-dependent transcriptional regulator n=1 Tax=Desulfobulbus elongatus TaxID=53332 RepID=UPI000486DC15|nr:sigma-54 dependent transcriptional regulator [Desulfobulbus elongatus]